MLDCPTCATVGWVNVKGKLVICGRCAGKGRITEVAHTASQPPKRSYKIAIVGEAWGENEELTHTPFVGWDGQELDRMLEEAEIDRLECHVTNVFNMRPMGPHGANNIKNLCTTRKESHVPMAPLAKNCYLKDEHWHHVERLIKELREVRPQLIIALGSTALWALTGEPGIRKVRGTALPATRCDNIKILPTYHPGAVRNQWELRSVVVADLMKARRESQFPEIRRPQRELWIEPTLAHIELFYKNYVLQNCKKLAFDIETAGSTQITCIGFAPSRARAIVIPFVDVRKENGSYWDTPLEERLAWELVRKYLTTPELDPESIIRIGQNTLYDINWLWSFLGLTPKNYLGDTMLKHHAIQPEYEKSLGFLGSIYTDEPAWKTMRGKGPGTIKRGE